MEAHLQPKAVNQVLRVPKELLVQRNKTFITSSGGLIATLVRQTTKGCVSVIRLSVDICHLLIYLQTQAFASKGLPPIRPHLRYSQRGVGSSPIGKPVRRGAGPNT